MCYVLCVMCYVLCVMCYVLCLFSILIFLLFNKYLKNIYILKHDLPKNIIYINNNITITI